jgi:aminoglycoside phosphotransferase (APT) family kinase protein
MMPIIAHNLFEMMQVLIGSITAFTERCAATVEANPAQAEGWLEKNAPPKGEVVLCHGDFRTGNYMAQGARLTGILDWEFCHWGDAHLDIGWFCAPCWRFGAEAREAGGIGSREAFYRGYNARAQTPLDAGQVPYWEILAAARWAVVALLQGERHITGGEPSLELLLTGLMAPEMEYDALKGIQALEGEET